MTRSIGSIPSGAASCRWMSSICRGASPAPSARPVSRSAAIAAFDSVVEACAEPDFGRPETWINSPIERLSAQLFALGYAHSVECWRGGLLVGGLYGISLGGAFFGESMFSRERDASKVALAHLVLRLRLGGYRLLDTQFITSHLAQFGTIEISRADYRRRLADAIAVKAQFYGEVPPDALAAFLQSSTQRS